MGSARLARRRAVAVLATMRVVCPPTWPLSLESLLAQSPVVTVSGDVKRPGEYRSSELSDAFTVEGRGHRMNLHRLAAALTALVLTTAATKKASKATASGTKKLGVKIKDAVTP